MPASASHLERTFDIFLSLDIGKIVGEHALRLSKLGAGVDNGGLEADVAIEELHHLREVVHAIDVEAIDHSRLEGIGPRQNETIQLQLTSHDGHGQGALDGPERAIQRQFAHKHVSAQLVGRDLAIGRKNSDGKRQVIGRTFLLDVGGRHVNHNLLAWELVSRLLDGAAHALGALLDSGVGQSNDHKSRSRVNGYFNFYLDGIDAMHCGCYCSG